MSDDPPSWDNPYHSIRWTTQVPAYGSVPVPHNGAPALVPLAPPGLPPLVFFFK